MRLYKQRISMPIRLICLLLGLIPTTFVLAQQRVKQAPVPAWVEPITARWDAKVPSDEVFGGVHTLLRDFQFNQSLKTSFKHQSDLIINEKGLEELSEAKFDFDPSFETLEIHFLRIYREGKLLDRLEMSRMAVIQMEQRADRHLYDGNLSAVSFIEDLRVGDVVDYAYSIKGQNPIMAGHYATDIPLNTWFPLDQIHYRLVLPSTFDGHFRYENDAPEPTVTEKDGSKIFTWHLFDVPTIEDEENIPDEYDPASSSKSLTMRTGKKYKLS